MGVKDAVANRFIEICNERNIKINELANISGVTPSTAYSMLDENRRDISIITIKKFCDGLDITLGEFFSTKEFDNLELYHRVATRNFNTAKEYEHSILSSRIRQFFGQIKEEINKWQQLIMKIKLQ